VRRFGGFNNNPTTKQFKSAYRKLLSHVSISVPLSASCTPEDDTLLLKTKVRDDIKSQKCEDNIDVDDSQLNEICSKIPHLYLSEYISEIIAYISGAVCYSGYNQLLLIYYYCIKHILLKKVYRMTPAIYFHETLIQHNARGNSERTDDAWRNREILRKKSKT